MGRQRSLGRYRLIDLSLWSAILLVFETITLRAAVKWFPNEPFWVSVVPAVTAIVYMRWGPWGVFHAVAGGVLTSFLIGLPARGYAIYAVGNALSLTAIGIIKLAGRKTLQGDALKSMLYAMSVFLLMEAGKVLMSLILGWSLKQTIGTFAPEIVTLLFTVVIVWIARRLDGVLEYQQEYVKRVQRELENERGDMQ